MTSAAEIRILTMMFNLNEEERKKRLEELNIHIATLLQDLMKSRAERQYILLTQENPTLNGKSFRFSLGDALEKILNETKRPMTSGELADAVAKIGFPVGKQAVSSLLTKFNQKGKRFTRTSPGYYYLANDEA